MPVTLVHESEAGGNRGPRIFRTSEWADVSKALHATLPADRVLVVTFSDETRKLFKNDEMRPARSLAYRLRKEYGQRFKIGIIGGTQIQIRNLPNGKS
jgi:hypothetical protein